LHDYLIEKTNAWGQIAAAIEIRHGPVVEALLSHGDLILPSTREAVSQEQLAT
jgi:hypothetical protein